MPRRDRRAALALALLTVGCEGAQSALEPRGPQAAEIFALWNVMFVGGMIIFLLVTALVLIAVALPRHEEHDERGRLRWVIVGGIATIVLLIALLIYNAQTSRAITAMPVDPIEVRVTARQWWWDVTYVGEPASRTARTANELRIPVGRPVAITLESHDVIHSFWVPNLHGKMDVIPGRPNRFWLQADAPGTYRGQCAEFCGLQHAKMAFLVIALPPADYEAWLEAQLQPAPPPKTELARRGLAVFQLSCAKCHAIRGTPALAAVAPDLTHVASRRALAAAALPNRPGHLAGWIADPQHTKPGTHMPPTDLEADSLHALLHYLESLR